MKNTICVVDLSQPSYLAPVEHTCAVEVQPVFGVEAVQVACETIAGVGIGMMAFAVVAFACGRAFGGR